MKRVARLIMILGALVAAGGLTYWVVSYDPTEFHGAGLMEDTGFLSYPRYHAPLGEVPLATEGSYRFRFSGVPSETMALQLYAPGYSLKNREQLETLSTHIAVKISDASGNVVCSGSGRPTGRLPEDRWVLMSSGFEAAFWHDACNGREFKRGRQYVLDVSVKEVDAKSPRVTVRAMLEGGGNELP